MNAKIWEQTLFKGTSDISLRQFLAMQVHSCQASYVCAIYISRVFVQNMSFVNFFSDEYLQWYKIKVIHFLAMIKWATQTNPLSSTIRGKIVSLLKNHNLSIKLRNDNESWWGQMCVLPHITVRRQTFVTETPQDPHRALVNWKHKVRVGRKSRHYREMLEGRHTSASLGKAGSARWEATTMAS